MDTQEIRELASRLREHADLEACVARGELPHINDAAMAHELVDKLQNLSGVLHDLERLWVRWLQGQQTCGGVDEEASGPPNLCWCRCGGFKASKPVLVWMPRFQDQQTCVGVGVVAAGPANLCWCIQTLPPI